MCFGLLDVNRNKSKGFLIFCPIYEQETVQQLKNQQNHMNI